MRGVTTSCSYPLITLTTFQLTRLMRGVTLKINAIMYISEAFQLTRLMRGVTSSISYVKPVSIRISTHTPHARRDAIS